MLIRLCEKRIKYLRVDCSPGAAVELNDRTSKFINNFLPQYAQGKGVINEQPTSEAAALHGVPWDAARDHVVQEALRVVPGLCVQHFDTTTTRS